MQIDLFEVKNNNWSTDTLLSTPGLNFYSIKSIESIELPNPYNLNTRNMGKSEYAIITTNFDIWINEKFSEEHVHLFYNSLKNNYNKIIALDTFDTFELGFDNHTIKYFDKIIKPQGLYKNKSKYLSNYIDEEILAKIELSFPCFISIIPEVRRRVRQIKNKSQVENLILYSADKILPKLNNFIRKKNDVNFIGSATNTIRIDLAEKLSSSSIKKDIVLSYFPQKILNNNNKIIEDLSAINKYEKYAHLSSQKNRMNRYLYFYRMMQSKISISPPGYGQLAFRHGEAMMVNRLLLCKNLESVDIKYDFINNKNCVFYENINSIEEIMETLLSKESYINEISENGYETWNNWASKLDELYYESIIKHIE